PPLRYLAYGVPLLVLLTCMADRKVNLGDETKPFLVILMAGLVLGPLANNEGWKDLFFVFAGVSVAMLSKVPHISLWRLFLWLMLGFAFQF
ncbi:hypothetical protein ABTK34_19340, partial [Acinetobacter baumannii]